jgi:hypothetical protein
MLGGALNEILGLLNSQEFSCQPPIFIFNCTNNYVNGLSPWINGI